MPEPVKQPGETARYRSRRGEHQLEDDWQIIRFEPTSGNVILERGKTRVTVPRPAFDALNFPGSDAVCAALRRIGTHDATPNEALAAFSNNDLKKVHEVLMEYARTADPSFSSVQTVADLHAKITEREKTTERSVEILKLDLNRAEREYNSYSVGTTFEHDKKDGLLMRVRDLHDQLSSRQYEQTTLCPLWHELFTALSAVERERNSLHPTPYSHG